MPLQGERRANTVTQRDCPGLGGAALSGRIGKGGDGLYLSLGRVTVGVGRVAVGEQGIGLLDQG